MGWQDYVDNLVKSGKCTQALLCGHDGTVWVQTANFMLQGELPKLLGGYKDPNSIRATSPKVGGKKCIIVKCDERSIYGKAEGDNGVCVVKTTQAVIVAWYEKPIKGGECNAEVERIADFLIDQGY
eukprot:gene608-8112_t